MPLTAATHPTNCVRASAFRPQSFEILDLPVRWYTFKRRPVQAPSAQDLELPEEAGGGESSEGAAEAAGGGGDNDNGDEEDNEETEEEVLPPPPALRAVYARGGGENFLLAMGGWARGAIFECSWEVRTAAACRAAPYVGVYHS